MKKSRWLVLMLTSIFFVMATSAAVAALLCLGVPVAEAYGKVWYDADGLFHNEWETHVYVMDKNGRRQGQEKRIIHEWYDKNGNKHEIVTSPAGPGPDHVLSSADLWKANSRFWYDEDGLFHKEVYIINARGDRSTDHYWYDKKGRMFMEDCGYVFLNGDFVYSEGKTWYDQDGYRHDDILWIYFDDRVSEKHVWFDKDGRHEVRK